MAYCLNTLAQNTQKVKLKIIQMTKESNNQITGSTDTQSVDRSLLEYLKPKSEDRFSKLEAYCDLLSRASSGAFVAANGERREELVPGQFVASISELARKWKWQRATVRSFVEGLVALGQLSYKPFVKSYIFTVNLQQRLSLYVTYLTSAVCSLPDSSVDAALPAKWQIPTHATTPCEWR